MPLCYVKQRTQVAWAGRWVSLPSSGHLAADNRGNCISGRAGPDETWHVQIPLAHQLLLLENFISFHVEDMNPNPFPLHVYQAWPTKWGDGGNSLSCNLPL